MVLGLNIVESCLTCALRLPGAFCDLPAAALQHFNTIKFAMHYPKGVTLFSQGQPVRGVFVLCQGHVRLAMSSRPGRRVILRIAEPGDVLGLSAAVSGRAYPITAETVDACQVNFVKASEFVKFMRSDSAACFRVAEKLSEQCVAMSDELRLLALSHSAKQKLASVLLQWSSRSRRKRSGVLQVPAAITHDEIAEMIGTSRETVTRPFTELRQQRVVRQAGTLIINRRALRAIARDLNGSAWR